MGSKIKARRGIMVKLLVVSFVILMAVLPTGVCANDRHSAKADWAVLVVDVQPCFVQGGSLAVAGANTAYVRDVQQATKWLHEKGLLVLGSRDYHPADHVSFYTNHPGAQPFDLFQLPSGKMQVLWPPHCVQTAGDSFELVDNNLFYELIKKGQDPRYDSYSAFRDDGGANTELDGILKARGVKHLVVYGIATDYCVKASVIDALNLGYSVVVIENLIRGVAPDTSAQAITDMKAKGAKFLPTVRALK
jgi:nicotinamidase/pyrazinamidase